MKSAYYALGWILSLSVYFVNYSFAAETVFDGAYLSCVDSDNNYKNKSYATNVPADTFNVLMNAYGNVKDAKNNTVHLSGTNPSYLFISGTLYPSDYVLSDYNQQSDKDRKGYLIFDTVGAAQNFCTALSNACIASNGEQYKYAVGGRPGIAGFYNLGILYKDGATVKTSICPTPALTTFPNNGGHDPAPCKNCGRAL